MSILRDFLLDISYWQTFCPRMPFTFQKAVPEGIMQMIHSTEASINLFDLQQIAKSRMNPESQSMRNTLYVSPLNQFYQAIIDANSVEELEHWIIIHKPNEHQRISIE